MNFSDFPWLESMLLMPLLGVVSLRFVRQREAAIRMASVATGATLVFAVGAWVAAGLTDYVLPEGNWQVDLFGQVVFHLDRLSAPLPALGTLLHFLTLVATSRSKMQIVWPAGMLASVGLRMALFSCVDSGTLATLLLVGTLPPLADLIRRGERVRVYLIHMALFSGLLLFGVSTISGGFPSDAGIVALLVAVLTRTGTVPLHCWVTDLLRRGSVGESMLFLTPLSGVYLAIRLVIPTAPGWALQSLVTMSLVTAVYAACMACVQRETRSFFAYFYLSQAALVLVGLELHTSISLTGSLIMWLSASMAVCGVGLTLRALEARHGRLELREFHGLYDQSPALAVGFLLTGLACVGFPGTLGFVAGEMLVDGAIATSLSTGLAVVLAAAFNGIAAVRVYFLLFTGRRPASTLKLSIGRRERFAVMTLVAISISTGLVPQPSVDSRHRAAEEIVARRKALDQPPPARP